MCRELQTAMPPVASVMRGDTGMMEEVGMLEEKELQRARLWR